MELLPMDKLGPRAISASEVRFGLYLPWVSPHDGHRLFVKVIHERDQFLQDIPTKSFELTHEVDAKYGDYWSTHIAIDAAARPHASSAWGTQGTYVYRFELHSPQRAQPLDWIVDPYAREFGVGKLSAITLGYQDHVWSAHEANWKTPAVEDLVVYEIMVREFGSDLQGATALLDYLRDLGINCIEVMPVSNVALVQDWGFLPLGLFGVDERFGNRRDFQAFVDAAHQRGIAVILDAVYGHTSSDFPYQYVYSALGYHENPFMGAFAADYFGCSTDFRRKLTQDFYYTVNEYWLQTCHVDGFRYDCVPNYYAGATGPGYADLVYNTYQRAKEKRAQGDWPWLTDAGRINLIQCAEQLEGPIDIVQNTYSTATWQNETWGAASRVAYGDFGGLSDLGLRLGASGYPSTVTVNGDTLAKSVFQCIENHDHERFICKFGMWDSDNPLLAEGDRGHWYRLQPYLIGLLTAKGVPMLWQGQELCQNNFLPDSGFGRVAIERPVRWDFFYDEHGRSVLGLVRKLLALRNRSAWIRGGDHYFYNHWERYQSKGCLLFSRSDGAHFSLVALNFSEQEQRVPFWFPTGGDYREELHGLDNLDDVVAGQARWLTLPGNYGRIWTRT